MSQLIPFGQETNLPSLAGLFDGLSNLEKPKFVEKFPSLSVKGGKFHGVVQGESTTFVDQDGVPLSSLDVIIVGAPSFRSRVFYANKFDPANPAPPDCHSMNGRNPDADVETPPGSKCQTCEKTVKVRDEKGKERTPCQQVKYLAVVVRGQEDRIYRLRLPMTSLYDAKTEGQPFMAFDQYCDYLRKYKTPDGRSAPIPHTSCVVTKMIFDANAEYPKLLFKAVAHLSEDMLRNTIIPVVKSDLVKEMCEGSAEQIGNPEDAPKQITAPAKAPEPIQTPAPVVQEPVIDEAAIKAAAEAKMKEEMEARIRAEVEAKMKAEMAAKATQDSPTPTEKPAKTAPKKSQPVVVDSDADLDAALSDIGWD